MTGLLDTVAEQYGLDPQMLDTIARIESSGNPNARTGSYKGLFQLSDEEFRKYGGGDIYNAADNANAAGKKIAAEAQAFRDQYGRDPDAGDIYMLHQQGTGGYGAHMANPDRPAWENMYSTAEGRQKGPGWAKQAIWGNIPDQVKAQFGNVDNVTSQQFTDYWRNRVMGAPGTPIQIAAGGEAAPFGGAYPGTTVPQYAPQPQGSPLTAQSLAARTTPAGVPMFAPQEPEQDLSGLMQSPFGKVQFAQLQRPRVYPMMQFLRRT